MLLTVDIGNTNMVFGIFNGEDLLGSFRFSTNSTATSDEVGVMAVAYFEHFGYRPSDVKACVIASVVPQVMHSVTSAIIKYFGVAPLVVDTDIETGIEMDPRCTRSSKLGTDRSVDCIAALKKYGGPFVILDFGTATTIDAIGPDGKYLGGTIGPGVRVGLDALVSRTAMLPRVELQMPETLLGRSTVEQIQAGVVGGYVGTIEYLVDRVIKEMDCGPVKVIATGGLAKMISQYTDRIQIVDSSLTLDGLRYIYEANRDAKPIEIKD